MPGHWVSLWLENIVSPKKCIRRNKVIVVESFSNHTRRRVERKILNVYLNFFSFLQLSLFLLLLLL